MIRLRRGTTALLVIDVQERLLPVIHGGPEIEKRIGVAIDGALVVGVPVLATEQYPKGLGRTVPGVSDHLGDIAPMEKTSFSCCGVEGVDAELARLEPASILIAGIETHVCVLQTCLDLIERGTTPVVLADCVGSRHRPDHRFALERLRDAGALITTLECALFELTGTAGTDEFKQISRLVKPL
ncbi:MAG: isochorismatase family protein [Spirochaetota bacterium]